MATCGSIIITEEKKEDTSIDHSLKNVVAFSSANMAMGSVNEPEGLFEMGQDGKRLDRRTKITYTDPKFCAHSFMFLCHMTSMLPTKVKAVGSGCSIRVSRQNKEKRQVLTCAHNVAVHTGLKEEIQFFNSLYSYVMRQGEKAWDICYSIDEKTIDVHPKHNGLPNSGFDIAICRGTKRVSSGKVKCYRGKRPSNDTAWGWAKPETLKKGMKIEISGYPGEKHGHPYTHVGEIVSVTETRFGGHILWHNVDCTKGNSGSPIIIIDKDWIKQQGWEHRSKIIVGIHTGQCLFEGFNYGTLITRPLYDWIMGKNLTVAK